jgi:glycosyltransferase involved in cell wall biosynthesis
LIVDIIGDDTLPDQDGIPFRKRFEDTHGNDAWFSRVRFHGHVGDEQLLTFYRDCSIFVAPSKYESFGLIYLEAMRFAKPCVGTNVGGIKEVVADGSTGILVPPASPKQLTAAILRLAEDHRLRTSMGKAGRERFEKAFTSERFANRIVQFVRKEK